VALPFDLRQWRGRVESESLPFFSLSSLGRLPCGMMNETYFLLFAVGTSPVLRVGVENHSMYRYI
jgi:hypothetical protein